jgi:predicted PurR-regulated permease PerM
MRLLARNVALVLATLTVAVVLWHIREGVVLFLVSLAVAAALRPTVDNLVLHRWPRAAALAVTFFTGLTLAVALAASIANPLMLEARRASNSLAVGYERLTNSWAEGSMLQQAVASRLPPPSALAEALSGERGLALTQTAVGITWNLFENVIRLVLVVVLSIYWSLDRVHFESLWLSLLPGDLRPQMREMWHDMESVVGCYLRSEVIQSLLAGLLLAGGYYLLGVRYIILLAIVGSLAWLLPWVGVIVAMAPAWLVGWHGGLTLATASALYTLGVFVLLEVFIEPRFFNRRRYNSLLAALLALALAELFGLIGLIIGPPLALALQVYFDHWLQRSNAAPNAALDLGLLEGRITVMRATLEQTEAPPPELVSMLDRLEALVADAGSVLEPGGKTSAA